MLKMYRTITVFFLTMLLTSLNAQYKIQGYPVLGKTYIKLSDAARFFGMRHSASGAEFSLSSKWSTIKMKKDSRSATVNGTKVSFSFAPTYSNRVPMISETDFLKILDPILRANAVNYKRTKRIVIDPGHGGKDKGASGKTFHEKNLVFNIAVKLKDKLKSLGFEVYLTRYSDSTVTLSRRPEIAKAYKADLFLSLHTNAASAAAKGVETYVLTPKNAPSTSGSSLRKSATTANSYDKHNIRLGYEIQKSIISQTKAQDRGVKHAQFLVLDRAPCPAVLIEMGFISNRYEESNMANAGYQTKLINGITNGILKYMRALAKK